MDSCCALLADMKLLKRKRRCVASLAGPGGILSQLVVGLARVLDSRQLIGSMLLGSHVAETCGETGQKSQHQDRLPVSQIRVLPGSAMAFTLACPTRPSLC